MQNIEYRAYKKIISNFYDFLKKKCGHEQSYLKSIPVTNLTNFILVPLSYSNYKDKDIITKLCEWRNKRSCYPAHYTSLKFWWGHFL